ncbi:hypothetical protein S245_032915, partial [Arachis hypogaea]
GQMVKHVWTNEETEVLVGFIEELVVEGRRADAGQFRPGSFEKLAAKMNERFSGACSSFRRDDVKQCVVVDNKEILAGYMKSKVVYSKKAFSPLYALEKNI